MSEGTGLDEPARTERIELYRSICRQRGERCTVQRRVILEALNVYCMDNAMELLPAEFPNLDAARDTLAPGGSSDYVKDWNIFECPVTDNQDEHDYAYVWDNGELVDIGDLTALIAYLYIPPNPLPDCPNEANVDGDIENVVDIGDLTALIAYLYISGPNPAECP